VEGGWWIVNGGWWRVEGGWWKLLRHESAEGQGVKADGGAIFVVDNLLFQASLVRSYRELSGVIRSYREK